MIKLVLFLRFSIRLTISRPIKAALGAEKLGFQFSRQVQTRQELKVG